MTQEFDIVVVGAGMIGTTVTCLLAKQGLKVALLDHTKLTPWSADTPPSRVNAISPATINIFKFIGIWPSILDKRACPYHTMRVWDQQTDANITFEAAKNGQPVLGYIVENQAIIHSAIERLRQNYLVTLFENTRISHLETESERVSVAIEDRQDRLCAHLVIGADGARSLIRTLSEIKSNSHDYRQQAIVSTLSLDSPHQNTAWQCFQPTGPVALLPLQDNRCSLVWSCDNDHVKELVSLSDRQFCDRLSTLFQSELGRITACSERFSFPLKQHHAKQYFAGRCTLVGDAAHRTHPLAGLGANIGFLDAAALSQTLEDARSKNRSVGNQTVLRRYERWRRSENELILSSMKVLESLFAHRSPGIQKLRELGVNMTDHFSLLKDRFAHHAMGLSGDLPRICKTVQS